MTIFSRPARVEAGSNTAKMMDRLEAAALAGDRIAARADYLALLARVDAMPSSALAVAEANDFADYLDQFDGFLA